MGLSSLKAKTLVDQKRASQDAFMAVYEGPKPASRGPRGNARS